MRRLASLSSLVILSLMMAGCSGQLGHDSPVQVRLESSTNTVDLTNVHVIISPNNGSATSVSAASDTQSQIWATLFTGVGFRELDFTTTSQQVPYFVYVKNSSGVQEDARLRIVMDGNTKFNQVVTVAANSTVQETTVFRNNVQ
jgi:hypothetical protein